MTEDLTRDDRREAVSRLVGARERPTIWVVTDQLPFPPRNGVTLPVFNYLEGLRQTHAVQLIFLHPADKPAQAVELERNAERFGPVICLPFTRKPKLRRVLGELACREMYQHGWTHGQPPLQASTLPQAAPVAVLVSPMSAVAKWRARGQVLPCPGVPHVAAVSDCTTAEYYFRGQMQVGKWRERVKGWLDRGRSLFIGRIEARLLEPYGAVFLQTTRDRDLMAQLVGARTAARVKLAPNGVAESFLSVQPNDAPNLVFVGELSGEYAGIALWLVQEVWPRVRDACPGASLAIVGRGASPKLRQVMAGATGVVHREYVADLADVYREAMIAICPVFKGFGLINKTLEGMACGLPVVGGLAAFNGIDGFAPDMHGVVCRSRSTDEFVNVLRALMADPVRRRATGQAGRALIAAQFKWSATVDQVRRSIEEVRDRSAP